MVLLADKSGVTNAISPARGGSKGCLNLRLPGRPGRYRLVLVGDPIGAARAPRPVAVEIGSICGTGPRPAWVDDAPSLWELPHSALRRHAATIRDRARQLGWRVSWLESVGLRRGENRSLLAGPTGEGHARWPACAMPLRTCPAQAAPSAGSSGR